MKVTESFLFLFFRWIQLTSECEFSTVCCRVVKRISSIIHQKLRFFRYHRCWLNLSLSVVWHCLASFWHCKETSARKIWKIILDDAGTLKVFPSEVSETTNLSSPLHMPLFSRFHTVSEITAQLSRDAVFYNACQRHMQFFAVKRQTIRSLSVRSIRRGCTNPMCKCLQYESPDRKRTPTGRKRSVLFMCWTKVLTQRS